MNMMVILQTPGKRDYNSDSLSIEQNKNLPHELDLKVFRFLEYYQRLARRMMTTLSPLRKT
jgi:hypothetical protein